MPKTTTTTTTRPTTRTTTRTTTTTTRTTKPPRGHKTYEIRVFIWTSAGYSGDTELIATIDFRAKDVWEEHGRPLSIAIKTVEEYVRNIGLFGISVEDPAGLFTFYPPTRIAKIEYDYIDRD